MTDDLENKYRIMALKKAAIVMNGLADSFKDEATKSETKSLAWTISWAVTEIERLHNNLNAFRPAIEAGDEKN